MGIEAGRGQRSEVRHLDKAASYLESLSISRWLPAPLKKEEAWSLLARSPGPQGPRPGPATDGALLTSPPPSACLDHDSAPTFWLRGQPGTHSAREPSSTEVSGAGAAL